MNVVQIDRLGGHISGVISLLSSRVKYNVCRRKEKHKTMLHHVVSMGWEAVGRLLGIMKNEDLLTMFQRHQGRYRTSYAKDA